jgi:hypothetical protein
MKIRVGKITPFSAAAAATAAVLERRYNTVYSNMYK